MYVILLPVRRDCRFAGKSPAQIIIQWHMQMGFSVIPGASNPDYIKENIETFDFALSNHEMERIHQLNKEKRYFNMSYEDQVKWFSQFNPTDWEIRRQKYVRLFKKGQSNP